MSRATISTGDIVFTTQKKSNTHMTQSDGPMHIAIIGDFSARHSRNEIQIDNIASRKPIEVDRDNFESIFSNMNIQLQLPVSDEVLSVETFDDLQPDFLYEKLPLFENFRRLRNLLKKPDRMQQAIDEIQQWTTYKQKTQQNSENIQHDLPNDITDDLLGNVLAQNTPQVSLHESPKGFIDNLIKDIIAPYVEPAKDPRQAEMQEALNQAINNAMRRIMHASEFQQLEASWRSVDLLTRRINTNNQLKLFLIDVSKAELNADIAHCNNQLEKSAIYKLLVEQRAIPGGIPFSLINADFFIKDQAEDIRLAAALASLADSSNAAVVCGADTRLAGCDNLSRSLDPDDWSYPLDDGFSRLWQQFRQCPEASRLSLTAPRFMLRLPYGKKTSLTESFTFEELPESGQHPYYLWGNSTYLVTLLLAQSYSEHSWGFIPGQRQRIENLPQHIYYDGVENQVKPCAEVMLTDTAAAQLASAGLMNIRSVQNSDTIVVPSFNALSAQHQWQGPWKS